MKTAPRVRKPKTIEQANEQMQRGLGTKRLSTADMTLTPREQAVVYQAWLDNSIGPLSQWSKTEPPAVYRRAWESVQPDERAAA